MNFYGFLAIGSGASIGAWLRWWLSMQLNPLFPALPLGTLAANLIGGYFIGAAIAVFSQYGSLAPEVRLFVITGLLGGLTTFSTFSAEIVTMASRGQYGWALSTAGLHLAGSLVMTALGVFTLNLLLRA